VRRGALILLAAALLIAGCGTDQRGKPAEAKSDPGARVFAKMGCGSCHRLTAAGSTATIGPNLDNALRNRSRDSIVQAIVHPPRDAVMPADFGQRMSEKELDQLVDFLTKVTG
jgi:mono/diheme cytochrome c family protein